MPPKRVLTNAVGIDLGRTTYVTLATGSMERIGSLKERRKRAPPALPAAGARAGATRPGQQETGMVRTRGKARLRVTRLHHTVARQRADFQHKLTTALVRHSDLLCVEVPNIAGLARTKVARSFADAAFGELLRQSRYKSAWRGKHVVVVGRWFPSSKTCGAGGHVHAGLTLAERAWTCPACGVAHDRDANAARNILGAGGHLLRLRDAWAGEGGSQGRGVG